MTPDELAPFQERKARIRRQAHDNRNAQEHKDEISITICEKFVSLPEYAAAETVMFYLDARSEVRTRHYMPTALQSGKRIVVPYCVEDILHLFWLESMDELTIGMWKILEPPEELRQIPEKQIDVKDVDLVLVPGVAFDRRGARMGHGKGYYDKLLERARPGPPFVALAFECQVFPDIPTAPHDIFMDKIITEKAVYQGKGRRTLAEIHQSAS